MDQLVTGAAAGGADLAGSNATVCTDAATRSTAGTGPLTTAEITEFMGRLASGAATGTLIDSSAAQLCEVLTGLEEVKNAAAAAQARVTDAAATRLRDQAIADGVARERADKGIRRQIGLARRVSPHAGSRHLGFARAIVHEMPHTHAAMTAGRLTEWTATQLVKETACLSREHRAQVDARLADRFGTDSHKKLVATAKALAYELDPYSFVNRGRKAIKDRRVTMRPAPDVMALVSGFLPAAQGVACYKALDEAARALKATGDGRSLDQLRADLFIARLTGQEAAETPTVELGLVMTDAALLGAEETAAHLDGYGPLPAGLARDLARQAATWLRRMYSDPDSGVLTGQDQRRRLFSGALRRFMVARDQVCRTPWCDAPVRHADHILPFARGGTTTEDNGQGLCEACNYDKEAPGWEATTVESRPGRHVVTITTPTGHSFQSHAPPVLPTLGLPPPRPGPRLPLPITELRERLEQPMPTGPATAPPMAEPTGPQPDLSGPIRPGPRLPIPPEHAAHLLRTA